MPPQSSTLPKGTLFFFTHFFQIREARGINIYQMPCPPPRFVLQHFTFHISHAFLVLQGMIPLGRAYISSGDSRSERVMYVLPFPFANKLLRTDRSLSLPHPSAPARRWLRIGQVYFPRATDGFDAREAWSLTRGQKGAPRVREETNALFAPLVNASLSGLSTLSLF